MKGGFYNPPNGADAAADNTAAKASMKGGFYNPPNLGMAVAFQAAEPLQ